MRVQVKKWGNSASVRIPASVMAAASLRIDQTVDVQAKGGRIVIDPVLPVMFDINELIDAISLATLPDVIDFGDAVGDEIW